MRLVFALALTACMPLEADVARNEPPAIVLGDRIPLASAVQDVRCDTACELAPDRTSITTERLGPITVHASVRRPDGKLRDEAHSYVVVMPERLGVECLDDAGTFTACDGNLRADRPIVRAVAYHGDRELRDLPLLRINGVPNGALSLVELRPESRTRAGGVTRGTYTLEVAFADMAETVTLRAD